MLYNFDDGGMTLRESLLSFYYWTRSLIGHGGSLQVLCGIILAQTTLIV